MGGLCNPHSSNSKIFNMKADSLAQQSNQIKELGLHLPDQGSSSTQSTGQSHQAVSPMRGSRGPDHCGLVQSGNDNSCGKQVNIHMKPPVMSLGTPVVLPSSKDDNGQTIACIPYPYTDYYYGGVLAAYGSHTIIHPQMVGIAPSTQVSLPVELSEDKPLYVNPKQYRAILRRRQVRAKQEAQHTFPKNRKPYLHESRHLHAMKRTRGSGGRFLNARQLQEQANKPIALVNGQNTSNLPLLQPGGNSVGVSGSEPLFRQNDMIGASSTPSSSDITSVSDEGVAFQQQDHLSFASNLESHVMRLNMRK